MPAMSDFVVGLENSEGGLRSDLETVASEIDTATARRVELEAARRATIRDCVLALLPDLAEATLGTLARRVPGCLTPTAAREAVREEIAACEDRLRDLGTYDAAAEEARIHGLEAELRRIRAEADLARDVRDTFVGTTDVRYLIDADYGRATYAQRFWNLQYYRDWKAADEAVERIGLKSWADVLAQHSANTRALATIESAARDAEYAIASAQMRIRSIEAARLALGNAEATVLERWQVKLSARLDALDPAPPWMGSVAQADVEIAGLHERTLGLEAERSRLHAEIAGLAALRKRVIRSRQQTVPDEYFAGLAQIPRARYDGATVIEYSSARDYSFYDGMLYAQMMNYFEPPAPPPSEHHSSSSYDAGYASHHSAALSDFSGQS